MYAKLPYTERYQLPAGVGASYYLTLNINNPYDPWASAPNLNATNFDMLKARYQWCLVTGIKFHFTIYTREQADGAPQQGFYMVHIPYNPDTMSVPPVDNTLFNSRNVRYITVGNANTKIYHLKGYWNFNKLSGNNGPRKDPELWSFDCFNLAEAVNNWTSKLYQVPIRTTDDPQTCDILVRLTYYCKFWGNRVQYED